MNDFRSHPLPRRQRASSSPTPTFPSLKEFPIPALGGLPLKRAFDAVELTRSSSPDGRLLNASVRIADSIMMLNDLFPEFGGRSYGSGQAVRLTLYLPNADATWEKTLAAGCKVIMPIRDQFWGDRYGEVEDPFGYVWAIATHLEDLTAAEIEERRKKMFGGSKPHRA